MSQRSSGGFSRFTIDALIGNSRDSPPPPLPPVSDTDEWSTSSDYTSPALQYVVSCSRLEDVCQSPPPTTTTTTRKTPNFKSLEQQQSVDDVCGGSRHAFRVYRPASLEGIVGAASSPRGPDSGLHCGILETLQRRTMRWYSDVDNDHWRTPTMCDVSNAGRRISDIISTPVSSTGHIRTNSEHYFTSVDK